MCINVDENNEDLYDEYDTIWNERYKIFISDNHVYELIDIDYIQETL